ncbi:MAG: ABC-type transport auxiliary lipoprotein family protein [Pseudomonadota bacterium]
MSLHLISKPPCPGPGLQRRAALSRLAWAGIAGTAGLAGCGASLLPKPAPTPALYGLDDGAGPATPAPAAPGAPGAPGLLVTIPRAAPGLDTRLMAYQRQPQRIDHYAASEWLDTPPRLLAPLLVRALEASGAFGVVLLAPAAASTRWRLDTELLRLQQNFGPGPSQLRLTLRAVLVDSANRTVLAAREFDTSLPAASEDAAGGVAAAQRAALQVARDLAGFCAQAVARAGA